MVFGVDYAYLDDVCHSTVYITSCAPQSTTRWNSVFESSFLLVASSTATFVVGDERRCLQISVDKVSLSTYRPRIYNKVCKTVKKIKSTNVVFNERSSKEDERCRCPRMRLLQLDKVRKKLFATEAHKKVLFQRLKIEIRRTFDLCVDRARSVCF